MFFTPLDIQNAEFKKSMYGYSDEEVDMFLDKVMNDYQEMKKEIDNLQSKISILNNGMQQYKNMETSLKETLVLAQQTAEQVKETAVKKADNIVKEAEFKADEIVQGARYKLYELNRTLKELRLQATAFKADYTSALSKQMDMLAALDICDEAEYDIDIEPVVKKVKEEPQKVQEDVASVEQQTEPVAVESVVEPEPEVIDEIADEAVNEVVDEAADNAVDEVADEVIDDVIDEMAEQIVTDSPARKFFRRKSAERSSAELPSAKSYKSRFVSDIDSDDDSDKEDAAENNSKKSDLKKWFLDD